MKTVGLPKEANELIYSTPEEADSVLEGLDPRRCAGTGIENDSCVRIHFAKERR